MIRKTQKYLTAQSLPCSQGFEHETADHLYEYIENKGYYWDADSQNWILAADQNNDPASEVVKIRIWYEKGGVDSVASDIAQALEGKGYQIIDRSKVYPCRPPQANDGRVYLILKVP